MHLSSTCSAAPKPLEAHFTTLTHSTISTTYQSTRQAQPPIVEECPAGAKRIASQMFVGQSRQFKIARTSGSNKWEKASPFPLSAEAGTSLVKPSLQKATGNAPLLAVAGCNGISTAVTLCLSNGICCVSPHAGAAWSIMSQDQVPIR